MSVFGFPIDSSSGGDFLPIVKYDARAGRMFRVDRDNVGGEWVTSPVDITKGFKAIFDLENLEVGWIDFNTGGAPLFALTPMGQPLPIKPTPTAKHGLRVMLKLAKELGGDKTIRELANNSKAFLLGFQELYVAYKADAAANAEKLPVVVLEDTKAIKSGSGDRQSTNYMPQFAIAGWAPRGDLEWKPKEAAAPVAVPAAAPSMAPATGSTRVGPPAPAVQRQPAPELEDDFG